MSYIEISAYKCTCERCAHSWTAITIPRTCSKCRSPYWDIARGDKPAGSLAAIKEPEPVKPVLSELRDMIKTIEAKPKSDYHTKSIMPSYNPPPSATMWEEPTIE